MRGRRNEVLGVGVASLLALSGPAVADDKGAAVIWYRASDVCPLGPEFIAKLSERTARARLAQAGDHIDFVVTLVAAEGETMGRLERQTRNGTVAIRELRDASCERVADAMALSLALALDPEQTHPAPPATNAPEPRRPSSPSTVALLAPTEVSASTEPGVPAQVSPQDIAPPAENPPSVTDRADAAPPQAVKSVVSLGLQGGVVTGVSPSALARAVAFVDVNHVFSERNLALRFALVGAIGSTTTAVGAVHQWIVAGRGELCPLRLGGSRAGFRPCVTGELGGTGAYDDRTSGLHDGGVWAAPGVALRGDVALASFLAAEAEVGVMLPLVRQEVIAGQEALYRTDSVVFYADLGLSIGP